MSELKNVDQAKTITTIFQVIEKCNKIIERFDTLHNEAKGYFHNDNKLPLNFQRSLILIFCRFKIDLTNLSKDLKKIAELGLQSGGDIVELLVFSDLAYRFIQQRNLQDDFNKFMEMETGKPLTKPKNILDKFKFWKK